MSNKKSYTLQAWEKQGRKCCYCEKPITQEEATCEHLRRKSEGGFRTADNVAAACVKCNSERGAIDWFTYKSYVLGELGYACHATS